MRKLETRERRSMRKEVKEGEERKKGRKKY